MSINKVQIQFKRLQRHYDISVKTYDEASLLDLSHILRIWVELKPVLPTIDDDFDKKVKFFTGSPIKKVLKQTKNCQYIYSYLPKDGVTTYASNGHLASGPELENDKQLTIGVKVKNTGDSILLSQYCYASKALEQPYIKALGNEQIRRCNYANWLSSEIVRLKYKNKDGDLERFIISREILIKRVANVLDGSHTSLNTDGAGTNQFDEPIKWLMNFKCGGLPLPYFLLLKIAQDIVDNIPKILNGN